MQRASKDDAGMSGLNPTPVVMFSPGAAERKRKEKRENEKKREKEKREPPSTKRRSESKPGQNRLNLAFSLSPAPTLELIELKS